MGSIISQATSNQEAAQHLAGSCTIGDSPAPTLRYDCGDTRLRFRDEFNGRELEAAKLIEKYDTDRNKTLEREELRQLLRDYNHNVRVKDKDLQFILRVADVDQNDRISQNEVLFAINSWHALNNMPRSVGAAFSKYKIGNGGPLASVAALEDFLSALNDHHPVRQEEATFVRKMALSLGATESKADYEQMRKAVAVWYANVERGPTSKKQLQQAAHSDMQGKLAECFACFNAGALDIHDRRTQIIFAAAFIIFILVPGSNIWLSGKVQADYHCEHPHLSQLLWWSGIMMIAFGATILMMIAANRCEEHNALKTASRAVCGSVAIVVLMQEIFGYTHVMGSSMIGCGFVLWTASLFTYILMPLIFVTSICCGLPALYCYELHHNQKMDGSLNDDEP